jgi:3-oxoadipate enol-lactonase
MANFRTSDGCKIEYTLHPAREENSPCIALIHSLAMDGSMWDAVVRELAGEAHVLTYDCRGHGKSDKPAGPYTVEQFANDLAELFDHIGWTSAAVAGCSMGGCVTQAFAGLHPARATALGLIDTTAWYGAEAPAQWRERAENVRKKGFAGAIEFQTTRWFGDKFRAENPAVVKASADVFLANEMEAYASTCAMLGAADVRPMLAGFKMPVAVIVGEEDYATPVAMAQQMTDAIAGATLTVLAAARHLTPIESPDRIARELRDLCHRMESLNIARELLRRRTTVIS